MSACAPVLAPPVEGRPADLRDSHWTLLLDHLATELAREYVRLMEGASAAEVQRDIPLADH